MKEVTTMMHTESAVVFYVDDNPRSRRLLASILQESGFEVITATGALEALGLCKNISFDVALLNSQTSLTTGDQLAQEIKFQMPDVPVVLLSGRMNLSPAESVFVDAHFGRETSLDDLLDKLKELACGKPRAVAMQRSGPSWAEST
jgi:CheY-like chemotaxis protein